MPLRFQSVIVSFPRSGDNCRAVVWYHTLLTVFSYPQCTDLPLSICADQPSVFQPGALRKRDSFVRSGNPIAYNFPGERRLRLKIANRQRHMLLLFS